MKQPRLFPVSHERKAADLFIFGGFEIIEIEPNRNPAAAPTELEGIRDIEQPHDEDEIETFMGGDLPERFRSFPRIAMAVEWCSQVELKKQGDSIRQRAL